MAVEALPGGWKTCRGGDPSKDHVPDVLDRIARVGPGNFEKKGQRFGAGLFLRRKRRVSPSAEVWLGVARASALAAAWIQPVSEGVMAVTFIRLLSFIFFRRRKTYPEEQRSP